MSCECEQTNTINCTTCNNACNECSCPVETTFMPETTTCSEPSECSGEIYPAQCVIYEGPTLQCSLESVNNYPAVIHTLANNNDNITTIFENINSQLCYLFSKDYIKTMLSIIKNDSSNYQLKNLFCDIICTDCTLSCPSITSLVYNYNISNSSTLTVTFNAISGNPGNRSYIARAYKKNTNGTYNAVNAFTQASSQSSSITSMTIDLINLTGTLSTDEWLVSVKVYDPDDNSNTCYTGIDYGGNATNVVYNPEQCGTAITRPVVLTCCESCLCVPVSFNLNNTVLTFNFTYLSLTTFNNNYYAPTSYTFHWYKKTISGTQFANNEYTYVDSSTYTQGVTSPTTGTITTTYANGEEYVLLLLVTTSNVNCYNGLPVRSTSPNNTYTGAEIAKINCNKYMFPNT